MKKKLILLLVLVFSNTLFIKAEEELNFDEATTVVLSQQPQPAPAPAGQEPGITLNIPVIGALKLHTVTEPKKGFGIRIPETGSLFQLGPVEISSGMFVLAGNNLSFLANAQLFGKKAEMGIKEITQAKSSPNGVVNFDKITFGLTFTDKPTLEITPNYSLTLDAVDVVVEKNKPVTVVTTQKIFGVATELQFVIRADSADIKATMGNIILKTLIPAVSGTPLENIVLKQFKLEADNALIIKPNKQKFKVVMNGQADVSPTNITDANLLSNVTFSGQFVPETTHFEFNLNNITIPGIGTVSSAKIVIDLPVVPTKDKPTMMALVGTTVIKYEGVDPFNVNLSATFRQGGVDFSGSIEKFKPFPDVEVKKAKVTFNTKDNSFSVEGEAKIYGIQADVVVAQDAKGNLTDAHANLEAMQEYKPFDKTNVPGIKDITIKNPQFKFDKTKDGYETTMVGDAVILSISTKGTLHFIQDKGKQKILLEGSVANITHLSQIVPAFKNTVFDDLSISEMTIIVSSDDYDDTKRDITIKKGINFYGAALLTGSLKSVASLVEMKEGEPITIFGALATNPIESVFKAKIPEKINLKSDIASIRKIELEIGGSTSPTIDLVMTLNVKPSKKDSTLVVTARLNVGATEAVAAGTMQGDWKSPLGIKGVIISNVAVQLGINYELFPEIGPSSYGFAGTLKIGSKTLTMAGNLSVDKAQEMMLAGSLDGKLTIADCVDFAATVIKKKLKTSDIPDIGIENVHVYIVQEAMKIGELQFDPGLSIAGTIFIPNFTAQGELTLNESGFIGYGYCSPIKLGPLLISGTPEDIKKGVAKDGPVIHLVLTTGDQQLYASGILNLDPVFSSNGIIKISKTQMSFKLSTKIQHLFDVDLAASAALKDPDFYALIDFKSDFFDYIQKSIDSALTDLQKSSQQAISDAQKQVNSLNDQIKDVDNQIAQKNKDISDLKRSIDQKQKAAQAQINAASKKVNDAEKDLKPLKDKLDSLEKQWNGFNDLEKSYRWVDVGSQIAGVKTAYEVSKGTLEAAQSGLNSVVKKLAFDPTEAKELAQITQKEAEIQALNAKKAGIQASQKTALGVLGAGSSVLYGISEGGKIVTKSITGLVQIKQAKAEGSLKEIAKGKLPKLTLDVVIANKPYTIKDLTFDLSQPLDSAKDIANKVINYIK